jgi:hypothetical protein
VANQHVTRRVRLGFDELQSRVFRRHIAEQWPAVSEEDPAEDELILVAARLFSGFLVSKEGQQKIADLDNVVMRKTSSLELPWIVRSCASSIRPKASGSIITWV